MRGRVGVLYKGMRMMRLESLDACILETGWDVAPV